MNGKAGKNPFLDGCRKISKSYRKNPIRFNAIIIAYTFVCGLTYNFAFAAGINTRVFYLFTIADHIKSSLFVGGLIIFVIFCLSISLVLSAPFNGPLTRLINITGRCRTKILRDAGLLPVTIIIALLPLVFLYVISLILDNTLGWSFRAVVAVSLSLYFLIGVAHFIKLVKILKKDQHWPKIMEDIAHAMKLGCVIFLFALPVLSAVTGFLDAKKNSSLKDWDKYAFIKGVKRTATAFDVISRLETSDGKFVIGAFEKGMFVKSDGRAIEFIGYDGKMLFIVKRPFKLGEDPET
ncbi:hypothetical protein [Emcibacter sp.]|uniref:hypothetical protein n=1 Tax=Emcibacter sp. TaxID=1979954 RepID=UPI002AA7FBEB|nr:hypothetical protein [Emcibacter sp.]